MAKSAGLLMETKRWSKLVWLNVSEQKNALTFGNMDFANMV
jgi:hypothetical protein